MPITLTIDVFSGRPNPTVGRARPQNGQQILGALTEGVPTPLFPAPKPNQAYLAVDAHTAHPEGDRTSTPAWGSTPHRQLDIVC